MRTRSLRDEFSFAEKACALEVSLRGMEIYKAAYIVERICRAKEYFRGQCGSQIGHRKLSGEDPLAMMFHGNLKRQSVQFNQDFC